MPYETIEIAVLGIVHKIDGYGAINATRGDFSILRDGVDKAIVLMPGGVRNRELIAAPRRMSTVWVVNLMLYIPSVQDYIDLHGRIISYRQEIIDEFDKWHRLNGTAGVVNSLIVSIQEPMPMVASSGRGYIKIMFDLMITERTTVVSGE